jgi:hypothetical protein
MHAPIGCVHFTLRSILALLCIMCTIVDIGAALTVGADIVVVVIINPTRTSRSTLNTRTIASAHAAAAVAAAATGSCAVDAARSATPAALG